ncbi:ATP-dependent zinc metalloprotease FtsH [Rubinisphaera sp.]|uniref:ATP-dependent zinc metalloprotease FtsH n=1 Tax=Rubinisphaera sp. TaxID=2024857 RepID=UPI000C0D379C|nr:ATP-dependent zinc metalloprotease FtsH [Rubinisphaera sp.]MBV09838.1 cell division protein FtsH [Rubinisphaera sp.]HCS50831.1 cell division protein FtsH [Planctomycetaceae bacterium]
MNKPPYGSNENPEPPEEGSSRKKEKKPSSVSFWLLLIGGVLLAAVFTYITNDTQVKKIKLSEFERKLESGEFNNENVHELVFGITSITFQNLSKAEAAALGKSQAADAEDSTPAEDVPDEAGTSETESAEPATDDGKTADAKSLLKYRINIVGIPSETLAGVKETLKANEIDYDGSSPPAQIESLLYLLFLVLFILFFIMMFRRMGGAGGAMSFGRTRGKLVSQDDVKTTFGDVAGIDEAVNELREVVEFLKTPAKYQALGGRIPRGVLLVGPPGTGKTLLARAVAGEAGVPFYGLSGSDFVEMFVGVGAARVRDTFQQAIQRSPSIIFIDELDALGKTRGSGMPGGHDEREQTLNALLVEMDGFSNETSVIVMGATNRPETLDPALMRPGRFDRHVLVDKPDYKGREQILKVHASRIKMGEDVNLARLAKLTPGFSGADLANLANEAALLAARNDKKKVSMAEFEEAIERVVAGLEKSTRIIGEEERTRVAYHECGHALVACCLPKTDPVHKISIIPRGFGALGYILQRPTDDRYLVTKSELENRICVMLGGLASERVIYNEQSTGAQNDLERASDMSRRMVTEFGMSAKMGTVNYSTARRSPFLAGSGTSVDYEHSQDTLREIDQEVKSIIDTCLAEVTGMLETHKDILEHMTRDLIEMEVMDSNHLESILNQYENGPKIPPSAHTDPAINHGQEMALEHHDKDKPEASAPDEDKTAGSND